MVSFSCFLEMLPCRHMRIVDMLHNHLRVFLHWKWKQCRIVRHANIEVAERLAAKHQVVRGESCYNVSRGIVRKAHMTDAPVPILVMFLSSTQQLNDCPVRTFVLTVCLRTVGSSTSSLDS